MPTVQLTPLSELPEGSVRAFALGGRRIALFHAQGALYALDDTCSHADASLSSGEFDPDELCVECPLHGSLFDLRTGRPRTLPAFEPVATYHAFVQDGMVFVEYID
jgi:3-phenylpropionate/trans-cinnamate dioxygenase ferredoxin subunit